MIQLLADENLDGRFVRGLDRHYPEIDLIRVQDTEAFQQKDEIVLAVAAREGRVLLAHDLATIPVFAAQRIAHSLNGSSRWLCQKRNTSTTPLASFTR